MAFNGLHLLCAIAFAIAGSLALAGLLWAHDVEARLRATQKACQGAKERGEEEPNPLAGWCPSRPWPAKKIPRAKKIRSFSTEWGEVPVRVDAFGGGLVGEFELGGQTHIFAAGLELREIEEAFMAAYSAARAAQEASGLEKEREPVPEGRFPSALKRADYKDLASKLRAIVTAEGAVPVKIEVLPDGVVGHFVFEGQAYRFVSGFEPKAIEDAFYAVYSLAREG